VKSRMRKIGRRWFQNRSLVTNKWVGTMASTHGKPCSCYGCGNRRNTVGPTVQECRVSQEAIAALATEDSKTQIQREIEVLECDDVYCDCHVDWEEWEELVYEVVTGETTKKLAELNVTVTWAA